MKRPALQELAARSYDLLIVGGGIVGCGAARDAALRGLRVALVEQEDFGSGTTSRSSRLIHGGLRYLEHFDFKLVRYDLREREILLRIAPHLVHPRPFLVPMYRPSLQSQLRLRAGLLLYDALSYDRTLPAHSFLSRRETLAAEPQLEPRGLAGAARFFDGQVQFPERLCIENAIDAALHGAAVRNYTRVESLLVDSGSVVGAQIRDEQSGECAEVRALITLIATGAWLDSTLNGLRSARPRLLRTTRGIHLVTPQLSSNALVLFARSDGRLFFVLPWNGMSLIGTTDTDEPRPPEQVRADQIDVWYLLEETRRALPRAGTIRPHYSMAGVRALVRREGVGASEVSRQHALLNHAAEGGPTGVISVVGGKITGYRGIAEEAVDRVCAQLSFPASSLTAHRPLPGAPLPGCPEMGKQGLADGPEPGSEQGRYLRDTYGRRAAAVLQLAAEEPELSGPVTADHPAVLAEIVFAARHEAAQTIGDVFLRRTSLGLGSGHAVDAAPRAAALLGRELSWSAERQAQEVATYRNTVEHLFALPDDESDAGHERTGA